jgi:hypothetical protein
MSFTRVGRGPASRAYGRIAGRQDQVERVRQGQARWVEWLGGDPDHYPPR